MTKEYRISPIGYVSAKEGSFCLEIDSDYRQALTELQGFGFINVLWWCDKLDTKNDRSMLTCDQPYKQSPSKMGVFATRSPARPNPIALTPVAILDIDKEKGVIRVPYIDADDGTPILDIKPYHPAVDRIRDAPVPTWCQHWPQWYEDSATFDWAAEFVNAE